MVVFLFGDILTVAWKLSLNIIIIIINIIDNRWYYVNVLLFHFFVILFSFFFVAINNVFTITNEMRWPISIS